LASVRIWSSASRTWRCGLHGETARLARKRLFVGSLLTLLGTLGLLRHVRICDLPDGSRSSDHRHVDVPGGSNRRRQLQHSVGIFDIFDDCGSSAVCRRSPGFLRGETGGFIKNRARSGFRGLIRLGFEFRNVSFAYPNGREVLSGVSFQAFSRRAHRAGRRKRPGKNHHRQIAHPPLRPNRRTDSAGWQGSARL